MSPTLNGRISSQGKCVFWRFGMNVRGPSYDSKEYARHGHEIYERCVKPTLQPGDDDKFVLIDIETDDFEIDENDLAASEQLLARRPNAQMWIARVGHRAAYRLGFRGTFGRLV
jgi:hypothetical protein